jgi:hypothetical protein
MSTTTTTPPAGWYQDPADPAAQRWWDGTQWTADRRLPAPTPFRPYGEHLGAPTGSPQTLWTWLIAVLPFISFTLSFLVGYFLYWPLLTAGVPEAVANFAAYPVVLALAWLFAVQDWRGLGRRGYPRPNLSWMIVLPPLVYLVVRGRRLRKIGIKSTWIELTYVLGIVSVWILNAGVTYLATQL